MRRCDGPACRLRGGDCGLGAADGRRPGVSVAAMCRSRRSTARGAHNRLARADQPYLAPPLPPQPGAPMILRDAGFRDQPTLPAARRRGAYRTLAKIDAARAGELVASVAGGGFDGDGAFAARVLCERDPHLVVEGLAIVARGAGAPTRVPPALAEAATAAREQVGEFTVADVDGAAIVHAARVARVASFGNAPPRPVTTRSVRRVRRRPAPGPLRAPRRRHHRRGARRGRRCRRRRARGDRRHAPRRRRAHRRARHAGSVCARGSSRRPRLSASARLRARMSLLRRFWRWLQLAVPFGLLVARQAAPLPRDAARACGATAAAGATPGASSGTASATAARSGREACATTSSPALHLCLTRLGLLELNTMRIPRQACGGPASLEQARQRGAPGIGRIPYPLLRPPRRAGVSPHLLGRGETLSAPRRSASGRSRSHGLLRHLARPLPTRPTTPFQKLARVAGNQQRRFAARACVMPQARRA